MLCATLTPLCERTVFAGIPRNIALLVDFSLLNKIDYPLNKIAIHDI
jgi:hypothetical protein